MPPSDPSTPSARLQILAVDDEPMLLSVYRKGLELAGYQVTCAPDARTALAALAERSFHAIISDIEMPEMDGIAFLRAVRGRDLDVPVILVTGRPSLTSAAQAVEEGAFRYLLKPFELPELEKVVARAVRLHDMAKLKRQLLEARHGDLQLGDRAGLEVCFERALASVEMAFQPLVRGPAHVLHGYEALLRTREPALPHPGAVLAAAERLGRVHDLGRAVRRNTAERFREADPSWELFVNLHPADLSDRALYDPAEPLSQIAARVVLEITERAMLASAPDVQRQVAALRKMGFRIAVDDLGAGYAGLSSFVQLDPEVVKLDMSLVRDIDRSPVKQQVVGSMVKLCHDLKIVVVVEGIETPAERDVLAGLGADLCQGYLFGKPGWPFPAVRV